MSYFLAAIVFILGTFVGSFLNVVILRYGTSRPIFAPSARSVCFHCGKKLSAAELVPIFSFFVQHGKCAGCGKKISRQYPVVEFITGFIFLLIFSKFGVFSAAPALGAGAASPNPALLSSIFAVAFALVIWSILIIITFYDLKYKIIPDSFVFAFIALALVAGWPFSLPDLLAGPIFFAFFAALWFFSGGKWLGFGDAKLALGIGFLLGLTRGTSAMILAFWIGAAASIVLLAAARNLTMKSEIPFAPFLVIGTFLAFFWSIDIVGLSSFF